MECKHVFHFCISRAILYIFFPMSLYYQNTRTRSGHFPIFLFMAQCTGVALHVTYPRLQKSAPVFSRTESMLRISSSLPFWSMGNIHVKEPSANMISTMYVLPFPPPCPDPESRCRLPYRPSASSAGVGFYLSLVPPEQ